MPIDEVHEELRTFFRRHFPERLLEPDDDIFELGFGNSLVAMQLIEFVEDRFDIEIDADDLELENFRTITKIAQLVLRRCEGGTGERAA